MESENAWECNIGHLFEEIDETFVGICFLRVFVDIICSETISFIQDHGLIVVVVEESHY